MRISIGLRIPPILDFKLQPIKYSRLAKPRDAHHVSAPRTSTRPQRTISNMQRALITITTRVGSFWKQLQGPSAVLRALPALIMGTSSPAGKQLVSMPPLHSCCTTTTKSSVLNLNRNLRNPIIFPAYDWLPPEDDIQARPKHHWCLLSEIQHLSWFLRLRIDVHDLNETSVPVYFYTPDRGGAVVEKAKRGYTLALFYADKRVFVDGQIGVRVEDATRVKVRGRRAFA